MAKTTGTLKQSIPLFLAKQPAAWRDDLQAKLGALLGIAEAFDRDALKIAEDGNLSLVGRFNQLVDAIDTSLSHVSAFDTTVVQAFRDRAAKAEEKLRGLATPTRPADAGERVGYELRLAEVRASLRDLTPAERVDALKNSTDPTVFDAVLTAPPVLSPGKDGAIRRLEAFIPEASRAEIVLARAGAADATTKQLHQELTGAVSMFDQAVGIVRTAISAERPASPPDAPAPVVKEDLRDPNTGKAFVVPPALARR